MSLVAIETVVLIPSVGNRKREILSQIDEVTAGKVGWILMTYSDASGEELLSHLEALQRDPTMDALIFGGSVYRANGKLVGSFGDRPMLPFEEAVQSGVLYTTSAQGRRYDVAWNTMQSNGERYALVLRHNAQGTQDAINLYILRIAGIVLVISAFITLVMLFFLDRQLITPILTLRRDLSAVGQAICSDQSTPVFESCQFYRKDELGEVIATFRQMYQDIQQAICDRKQAEIALRTKNQQMQRYLTQVDTVTSATSAIDSGTFRPESLDKVASREDELGKLAQMFQLMAVHIHQREARLRAQVKELTIEIDQHRRQQGVAQIVESGYFEQLKTEAAAYQSEDFWQ
ncbi:MAG: HAMP domain-containing protein [Cyanobacteria bacterium P01_A01_bin.17]